MQMISTDIEDEARRGIGALQNGDFATARTAFDRVTQSGTASPQAWLLLAQSCEGLDDRPSALTALDRVLAVDPHNPFALLMKGDIYAREGDDRAATSFYRMGMRRTAELDALPGDLNQRVERAYAFLQMAEARFKKQLDDVLESRGIAAPPPRFAEAMAIASGQQPVFLQEPTNFYFPGLPQKPWYDPAEFEWVAAFEAAVPEMRAEVLTVLEGNEGLEPYVQADQDRASRGHSLMNDRRWSAFHLYKQGERVEENASRCPRIMQLLDLPPIPRIDKRSPMALVSILQPGTHIPPHNGMLNTRLICHIPLVVPGGCRLRVGAHVRDVIEGKSMIFDDSFEHEAWNDGTSARAVLLFEIWRPELSEDERVALTAMYEAITGYGADPES